jgi:hypothetical protein
VAYEAINNALILRELMQGARKRRTFVLRTVLPAVALIIVFPQVLAVLASAAGSWRDLKAVALPVFKTCSWLELITFPLLALLYAGSTVQDEWNRRTMEVLCLTPISRPALVYGKFACAIAKVVLVGLALLPVVGVWFQLGRVPSEMALGSVGVVGGATVLCGGLALVRGAGSAARRRRGVTGLDLLLVYLLAPILLGSLAWVSHPVLVAAVPPWAFDYISAAKAPGGMDLRDFVLLATFEPLAVGLLALMATPWVFRRAFERHTSGFTPRSGWGRVCPAWLWRLATRRPVLKPNGCPFRWQERGPPTRLLRWGLWGLYALVGLGIAGAAHYAVPVDFLKEPTFWLVALFISIGIIALLAGLYATRVFGREKVQRTASGLVLTGRSASTIYAAKVLAVYRALAPSLVGLLVPLAGYLLAPKTLVEIESATAIVVTTVTLGLFGPLTATVVGMVFGAASKTPAQAVGGVLLSAVWSVLMCICLVVFFVGAIVGSILMATLIKTWTTWRLSFLLAFTVVLVGSAVFVFGLVLTAILSATGVPLVGLGEYGLAMVAGGLSAIGLSAFWFSYGVHIFERCMLSDA